MSYNGIGASLLGAPADSRRLVKVSGDDPQVIRHDWTLSFVPGIDRFISFHGYAPLLYASGRTHLWASYKGGIYLHNEGSIARFYDQLFGVSIDALFAPDAGTGQTENYLLQTVSWRADVKNGEGLLLRNQTFSKATLYNSYQRSATVALQPLVNTRLSMGVWNFNQFRDMLKADTQPIDEKGTLLDTALDLTRSWQTQRRLEDQWFSLRLAIDNLGESVVYLQDVSADYRKSLR